MQKPNYPVALIDEIVTLPGKGPWNSKSGGQLNVLFGLPLADIEGRFFSYRDEELKQLSQDVRGLRSYSVSNIPKGTIGANEWHRLRNELVFAIEGTVVWMCEDVWGNKKSITLDGGTGVWVPPFILHSYQAQTQNSRLLVIANTLFMPDDPQTHDTYSAEDFRMLQGQYAS
jgi:dTDP-4-dehydrorhamnose 3,5-epimerase-like enzyme